MSQHSAQRGKPTAKPFLRIETQNSPTLPSSPRCVDESLPPLDGAIAAVVDIRACLFSRVAAAERLQNAVRSKNARDVAEAQRAVNQIGECIALGVPTKVQNALLAVGYASTVCMPAFQRAAGGRESISGSALADALNVVKREVRAPGMAIDSITADSACLRMAESMDALPADGDVHCAVFPDVATAIILANVIGTPPCEVLRYLEVARSAPASEVRPGSPRARRVAAEATRELFPERPPVEGRRKNLPESPPDSAASFGSSSGGLSVLTADFGFPMEKPWKKRPRSPRAPSKSREGSPVGVEGELLE